ncbi:MAG: proline--tRNA ligase [Planctomycetaceae bacterium]|nr:MAG: proline--tRNA ligase [Planctomycetaceae bacterium]
MRYSQTLIPTVKEVPAEAEIPSHQLMIRAGFIRKVASGTYTYLPLGYKSLLKIIAIIRQEMNAAGAQEILMPILQPMELWQQTGRDKDYGETMCRFTDRHGRENALAPTAEEVVTSLVAGEINSYKQLPVNLYQINTKFRDEFRPRFGVLRSREFIMKDAYSFHTSVESLDETYKKMYDAYCRIFTRCGLKFAPVEADSGPIGGSASHEFMVTCSAGEDVIVHTEDMSYAANIEKAEVDAAKRDQGLGTRDQDNNVPAMTEVHTPNVGSIEAVTKFLGCQPKDIIKTLIYTTRTLIAAAKEWDKYRATHHGQSPSHPMTSNIGYYVVLVRGDHEVNLAKLRKITNEPELDMASEDAVKDHTGAAVGFAGPSGLKLPYYLVVDHTVAAMTVGITGANKTDYHVKNVVPGRDFPLSQDQVAASNNPVPPNNVIVADIRNAAEGDTHGGKALMFSRGIEVGHVFKLGTKYSEKLGAKFLDEKGASAPCIMGCYGIGVNRILASAIEMSFDANGCILPISIAPFDAEVVMINRDNAQVAAESERIYNELQAAGVDVLLDDRDARPGVKFKDADLLGIPLRIVVGEKGLAGGNVEIKRRTDEKPTLIPVATAVAEATAIIRQMKEALTA